MASTKPRNEKQTRIDLIDPRVRRAGWTIVRYSAGIDPSAYAACAIEEFPTRNGPADYALFVNGQIIGLVEAKRESVSPKAVLTQDERYARGVEESPHNFDGLRVPFIYSSNGNKISFRDVRDSLNLSRQIAAFHTPEALLEHLEDAFQTGLRQLKNFPITSSVLRPYQVEANEAIEKAVAARRRKMLLAMATGTGKTLTMVHQVYRLMKAGVAQRVLFLVDRRPLAAQAVRTFAAFEAEPGMRFDQIYEVYSQSLSAADCEDEFNPKVLPREYLEKPNANRAFVYVCTIQRMMTNLFGRGQAFSSEEGADEDADRIDIPIDAFDLIVADECHRGYGGTELSVWKKTLNHFDGITVGLTATPAAHTRVHFGDAIYEYRYERAVREGYLVDYNAVSVNSGVLMNGVFLPEGSQVRMVDPERGIETYDLLEDERTFSTAEIEEKVTAPDTINKILLEIKQFAEEHEKQYHRFPKILIFAVNDLPHISHADRLVESARRIFNRGEGFVQKITGTVDRPLQRIREFRNRPNPAIVVTVDLLSTGVDIPDIEFIVFLRPVRSRILFEQMMGRGTRRGERFQDKSHFTIFDCFNGTLLHYFAGATGITAEPPRGQSRTVIEVIEEIWQNRDRDYNVKVLVKRLNRIDKEMAGGERDKFAVFIPNGDLRRFATQLKDLLQNEFGETMAILRNPEFQNLLMHYVRHLPPFVIADDLKDTVSSNWLIRGNDGCKYRPLEYLAAFSQYIQEHKNDIEAIQVLLDRPQDWSLASLKTLEQKLKAAPENFTIKNLQRAHEAGYRKALVEIISMIKHAMDEKEPLLTAEDRVGQALDRITEGREFTAEQWKWLDRIRDTLIENLAIDRTTFEEMPVLINAGGWSRANKVFENALADILTSLNEALAS